ncbi:hypothetical protein GCM10010519_42180 [Streptomyces lactacystinicus]
MLRFRPCGSERGPTAEVRAGPLVRPVAPSTRRPDPSDPSDRVREARKTHGPRPRPPPRAGVSGWAAPAFPARFPPAYE